MKININGKDLLKKAIIAYGKGKNIDIETEKFSIYINSNGDFVVDILDDFGDVSAGIILEHEDCEFTEEVIESKLKFFMNGMHFELIDVEIDKEEIEKLD